MRIYLDDLRPTPEGWVRTYTPAETIALMKEHGDAVREVSLDHDLGDDEGVGTGYDVILWIEEQVVLNDMRPPLLWVHSDNPAGRRRMDAGIKAIYMGYLARKG